jgi:hypothetical protein
VTVGTGLTEYTLENLPSGTYYIVMVALSSSGAESEKSAEVAVNVS